MLNSNSQTASNPLPRTSNIKAAHYLLSFSILLVGSGFVIVHSHLAKYGGTQRYNIPLGEYLAVGIGMFVFWGVLGLVVGTIYVLKMLGTSPKKAAGREPNTPYLERLYQRPTVLLTVGLLVIILVSALYGAVIYPLVPQSLGGGRPSIIYLTLQYNVSAASLGLTEKYPPAYQHFITDGVFLLAEYTDGLLVSNVTTGAMAMISNDAILGRVAEPPTDWTGVTPPFPMATSAPQRQ